MALLLLLSSPPPPPPVPCAADLKDVGRQGERLHTHTRARRHTCVRGAYAHTDARAPSRPEPARQCAVRTKTSRLAAPAATDGRRQHHSVANISIMFVCGLYIIMYRARARTRSPAIRVCVREGGKPPRGIIIIIIII